ncbi:Chloroperoxidase [Macrophomina phaseolina MS6]|uniref:Chloroperoxidase n=1 Tax=Macrophomina phaseolina (strain MS6) TaxID=1126212 RepID=K2S2T0_MACPH|nr:Chloroperoxidase [Macrophomina phaseolina MS6]
MNTVLGHKCPLSDWCTTMRLLSSRIDSALICMPMIDTVRLPSSYQPQIWRLVNGQTTHTVHILHNPNHGSQTSQFFSASKLDTWGICLGIRIAVCIQTDSMHIMTARFPYNNAKNGVPGNGKGGYQVPAPGDTAHQFIAPTAHDIRGPCPGLNAAANHGFLARDGIVTFNELVDAQQNVYNVGYDLSVLLAVLGLTLTDGDPITQKLSIGCDATTRTSVAPLLTGSQPGLDGHNKFEADTSLTRNDYFLAGGDNFNFNGTLFGMMVDTCQGNFNRENLALYRKQRYDQSLRDNENFYFGPLSLLLFGAASFLYELMPSGTHNYAPDLDTISSFFGAEQAPDGSWRFTAERIPDNWTNRVLPYTNEDVTREILAMYLLNPVLFGGATGDGGFNTLPKFGSIQDGKIVEAPNTLCLLYQLSTQSVPSSLNGIITPTVDALNLVADKLAPQFKNLGCPNPLT